MREVTPDECKQLQLNILINVAKFCEEHDIKYSLAYGTLIGAIRHKGFIPWDDDIDIIMMRNEYERFVATYNDNYYKLIPVKEIANHLHVVVSDMSTQLEFHKCKTDSYFYKGGVWVDIFPIDNVPNSNIGYKIQRKVLYVLKQIHQLSQFPWSTSFKGKALHRLLKPYSNLLDKPIQPVMQFYNSRNKNMVGDLALCYLNYPSFPKSYMDTFVGVEFEGHIFKAIKDYDAFLRGIYGNYMNLPPVNERTPRHPYTAYWREIQ
jgi:lipopolysaccharide cholinephosphotransferase